MASNRHLGRIIVLQSLYEYEFRTKAGDSTVNLDAIVAKDIEPYQKALGDTEFVYTLAHAVSERFEELDKVLQPIAPEWPLDTIAGVDRNVLRMGLYELQNAGEAVPPKVAINEAVELAKAFGSDNSSKFVNGVLGTAFRNIFGPEIAGYPRHAEPSAESADATEGEPSAAPAPESSSEASSLEEQHVKEETAGGEAAEA